MPRQVSQRSDIGNPGLGDLDAHAALCLQDDVAHLTMAQMEKLGAGFPICGKYAVRVPKLLKRFPSKPMGEPFPITIGWRKDDSASLMANSPGGRSIALLSLCLMNLYKDDDVGSILSQLSSNLLKDTATSSPAQLARVAKLLSSKLGALGFGNFLSRQAMEIYRKFKGKDMPGDFLQPVTTNFVVKLLQHIRRALDENDNVIVRIAGTCGMGYIVGITLMMFPHNTAVTISDKRADGDAGEQILLEFSGIKATKTRSKTLSGLECLDLPIEVQPRIHRLTRSFCSTWHGWLAERLQLTFLDITGRCCPVEVLVAICDLLVVLPAAMPDQKYEEREVRMPRGGLLTLLGPLPFRRMREACDEVLGIEPREDQMSGALTDANSTLKLSVAEAVAKTTCSCKTRTRKKTKTKTKAKAETKCDFGRGWVEPSPVCRRQQAWAAVGQTLNDGLACLFINASKSATVGGPNVTIGDLRQNGTSLYMTATGFLNEREYKGSHCYFTGCHRFLSTIFNLVAGYDLNAIGVSSGSSVICPTMMLDFHVPPKDWCVSFELVDGQFVSAGRYHRKLYSAPVDDRPRAKKSPVSKLSKILPCSDGAHSSLPSATVVERLESLELRIAAEFLGCDVPLNLWSLALAFIGLDKTDYCDHRSTEPLTQGITKVVTTSVASPYLRKTKKSKIGIAMAGSDRTAQLLCCDHRSRNILQRDCCLNCTVKIAGEKGRFDTVIVGCGQDSL